jgi:hypothetical protein
MTRLQFALLTLFAVVAGALSGMITTRLSGQGQRRATIEAKEFRVVDDDGRLRARLGVEPDGGIWLSLADNQGSARMWTGVTTDGTAMVSLRDRMGKPRLFIQADDEQSMISLRDAFERGRLYVQVSENQPLINLSDAQGRGRLFLNVGDEGPGIWYDPAADKPVLPAR